MNTIGHLFGLTKATEVLIVTLVGICCTIFDASILDLNTNLGKVWSVSLDPDKFSQNSQMFIKYLLSGIVLVRTFSVHLYLAFYIVMLWPAVFEERPNLLLPWLTVGAVKSLGMGFFAFTAGMYACFVYGAWRPACIDFFFAQIIDNAPSMYAWIIVLSYYRDLKSLTFGGLEKNLDKTNNIPDELVIRRRMARSINADPLIDNKNENFNNRVRSETSTIESRSLDSLLVRISNDGYVEGNVSSEVFAPSDEDPKIVNYVQRTIKVLDITDSDIQRAKMQQRNRCPLPSSGHLLQLLDSNVQKTANESIWMSQDGALQRNRLHGAEVSNKTDKVKETVESFPQESTEIEDSESKSPKMEEKKEVRKINGILERRRPIQKQTEQQICNEEVTTVKKPLTNPNEDKITAKRENLIQKAGTMFKILHTDVEEDKRSRLTPSATSSHYFSGSSVFSYTMSTFVHQFVRDIECEVEKKGNSDKEMLIDESEIYTTNYERDGSQLTSDSESAELELYHSSVMHSACCSKIIQPVDGIIYLGFEGKCYTTSSGYPKPEETISKTETLTHKQPLSVELNMASPQDFLEHLNQDEPIKLRKRNKLLPKYVNDGYTQDYLKKLCKTNILNEKSVNDQC
ncbi:uncharacterized protein LOC108733616 [Agrilus planipennis]|uniref:Uncharacterized protein LOC108733616 n=1 Tax=Agrilus planipennis TaxID=224129 RepID=A0A1W4WK15_AGRPL|nr:uncharacterized protein LOC108733616 [Agrilus planipennis]